MCKKKRKNVEKYKHIVQNLTHASSSCFILAYSSFVMLDSPSPNLCIFSRGPSKSGFGGAGGI